jgi:hypothetical protein
MHVLEMEKEELVTSYELLVMSDDVEKMDAMAQEYFDQ